MIFQVRQDLTGFGRREEFINCDMLWSKDPNLIHHYIDLAFVYISHISSVSRNHHHDGFTKNEVDLCVLHVRKLACFKEVYAMSGLQATAVDNRGCTASCGPGHLQNGVLGHTSVTTSSWSGGSQQTSVAQHWSFEQSAGQSGECAFQLNHIVIWQMVMSIVHLLKLAKIAKMYSVFVDSAEGHSIKCLLLITHSRPQLTTQY